MKLIPLVYTINSKIITLYESDKKTDFYEIKFIDILGIKTYLNLYFIAFC